MWKAKIDSIYTPKNDKGALVSNVRAFNVVRFLSEFFKTKQYSQPCVDSLPPLNSDALIEWIGGDPSQAVVRSFIDNIAKTAKPGEFRAYATKDGSAVVSFVHIKNDGIVELNGDEFEGLIKIQELTDKINFLINEIRLHKHEPSGVVPSTDFTDFNKDDYENTGVTHG